MFKSFDGKIGQVYGVRFYTEVVYIKVQPRFIPYKLWIWLAKRFVTIQGAT